MTLKPDNLGVFEAPSGITAFSAITNAVFDDEPCLFLMECDLPSENGKGKYRYQILTVIRDDRPAKAYVCLGAASNFAAPTIPIMGAVSEGNGKYILCHTVAELRDIAEELRNEPIREIEAPPMQELWHEKIDQKQRLRNHTSTFGSGGSLVRP